MGVKGGKSTYGLSHLLREALQLNRRETTLGGELYSASESICIFDIYMTNMHCRFVQC